MASPTRARPRMPPAALPHARSAYRAAGSARPTSWCAPRAATAASRRDRATSCAERRPSAAPAACPAVRVRQGPREAVRSPGSRIRRRLPRWRRPRRHRDRPWRRLALASPAPAELDLQALQRVAPFRPLVIESRELAAQQQREPGAAEAAALHRQFPHPRAQHGLVRLRPRPILLPRAQDCAPDCAVRFLRHGRHRAVASRPGRAPTGCASARGTAAASA